LPESLPRESRRPFEWKRANPLGTFRQILKYPAVPMVLGAMFLWQLAHQVLPSTWAFYTIAKFHWTSAEVGGSLAFVGAVMAIAQGLLTRVLIPWLGGERRAAGRHGSGCTCLPRLRICDPRLDDVRRRPHDRRLRITYPAMNALASQRIPANAQGELQGAVASLYGLSSILGPPLMTQVFGYYPSGAPAFSGRSVCYSRGAHSGLRGAVLSRGADVSQVR
jgi:DHA1 family tetracycline resistance protein-like MFS transporter